MFEKIKLRRVTNILKNKEKRIKEIIKIPRIQGDKLEFDNGNQIVILQVEPINFKMKSLIEQNAILYSFENFLKICDFDFQIFMQTQKADLQLHIKEVQKCILYENELLDMANDYINFIQSLSSTYNSMSRKFFIILKTDDNETNLNKIKVGLMNCGNTIRVCKKVEIEKILRNCFNFI